MTVTCSDRDRIFANGSAAEWAGLEAHAASCASCAEELRAWQMLSVAARELRDYSDSPTLWPRIESALAENAHDPRFSLRWNWQSLFRHFPFAWQSLAAATIVAVLAVAGLVYLRPHPRPIAANGDLLKTHALQDVERAETVYVQAVDALAVQAKPELDNPTTPLLASYREKLLLLDSAIDDLRAQAGLNPSNAHLRYELLAMYQEKQRTLEEILENK